MSYPNNPDTVVVKNKFYPNGLREIDVWNHYQKVKVPFLKETYNRDLMFYIMVDVNRPIIKRKIDNKFIRLIPKNYDTLITGRTVSIHSAMKSYEDFSIIDIDVDPSDGFRWAKKATNDVYEYIIDKVPIVRKVTIRYSGKKAFHIVCDFSRKFKSEAMKHILINQYLRKSDLAKVYTINEKKAHPGVPNLDLNRNCLRCNYITLHSLSVWGLKCIEVEYNKLMSFEPMRARI